MVLVHSHNPVVIREDRIYRYVGNGSDGPTLADKPFEEPALDAQVLQSGSNKSISNLEVSD